MRPVTPMRPLVRRRWMPAPGAAAAFVRTIQAGLAGAIATDAYHARLDGDLTLAALGTVVAALIAGWVMFGAVLDAYAATVEARRAERAIATARGLRRANRKLQHGVRVWRARAIHYQAQAERAEAEAHTAMLHTPLGHTLAQVHQLPDTRDRTS